MDSNMDALNTRNGNTNYYAHPGPARKKNKFFAGLFPGFFPCRTRTNHCELGNPRPLVVLQTFTSGIIKILVRT